MTKAQCKNCQFYLQHYGLDKRQFYRVYCGHCTFSGVRRKLPDTDGCEHFLPAPDDAAPFVTKEYLSKALLAYMLDLDLLPELKDAPILIEKKETRE